MLVEEHAQTARDFLDAAEREFAAGDELQGSEKIWGAASHAVRAVAKSRGWDSGKHNHLKAAVMRLARDLDDQTIRAGFVAAQQFHANFYHGFMEEDDIEIAYPVAFDFVTRMLDLDGLAGYAEETVAEGRSI